MFYNASNIITVWFNLSAISNYLHHPAITDFTTATVKMPGVKFPTLAEPVTLGALQLDTRVIMASLTRSRSIRKCLVPYSCYLRAKARHTYQPPPSPTRTT